MNFNPPQQRIGINPEQLRNQVQLLNAEVQLHEREVYTLREFGKAEREAWTVLLKHNNEFSDEAFARKRFDLAHKAHETAVVDIKNLEIAKLKSQAAIAQAMLDEAERSQSPGKVALT